MTATPAQTLGREGERSVLIIDDEAGIRRSLEGVLQDEGYSPHSVGDGLSALAFLERERPALVILDIWMPGMDGLEVLSKIKALYPDLPVIMVSGHATIATAIKATQLGASDFIEKPLDLHLTLQSIRRAMGEERERADRASSNGAEAHENQSLELGRSGGPTSIDPVVFKAQALRGRKRMQHTLARSALLYGQGLHSGKKSGLILEPLPPNSGIHFVGVSETTVVPAHLDFVGSTGFATTVRLDRTQAGTIEHLMSALHAYGISNLLIKCNGEVPVMDGSAREFCSLLENTGIEAQSGDWYEISVTEPITVGTEKEYLRLEPAEEFSVDYYLSYPPPVGEQRFSFTLGDINRYKQDIAPARTFGMVRDINKLQRQGLALGGRFDNFVLFGDQGPINDVLRFPDEPVRHKILDLIGDLYLLGRPLVGRITAHMTGHSDNIDLLKAIQRQMAAESN